MNDSIFGQGPRNLTFQAKCLFEPIILFASKNPAKIIKYPIIAD